MEKRPILSKRTKDKFLCRYAELDEELCRFFGIYRGGISEYINRLNISFEENGDGETLARLLRLRRARNLLVHKPRESAAFSELSRADVLWLRRFCVLVRKGRDPISRGLLQRKKHRRYIIAFLSLVFSALLFLSVFIAVIISKG